MNRNTKQRELILNIINKSYSHFNAYEVYGLCKEKIPNISLGTVYRNLNSLVEDKCIRLIKIDDVSQRYDRIDDKHAHFICIRCGIIKDVHDRYFEDDFSIDGNMVIDYEIDFKGICNECLKREE